MNAWLKTAAIAIAVGTSVGLGYLLGQRGASHEAASGAPDSAEKTEREALYWYDPMVPDQRFDAPGKSPFMDMMLVPRYADEVNAAGVQIDPGIQQNLGIRTAVVEVGELTQALRVPGTLQWDIRGEHRVSARTEGLIERLHVKAPYSRVRAGEPLATLLAPTLSSAVAEYRALAAGESAGARELRAAAQSRARLLGLNDADLRASNDRGVPRIVLRAPADGVLAEISVREGESVIAGQSLFRLNAIDSIWLEARVPQVDAGRVAPGTAVVVHVSAYPGTTFSGSVEAMLPDVDMTTRTQTARIVLANPDGRLAAGMFAEAELAPSDGRRCPLIPSEALILTGRQSRVIVMKDDGSFLPVRVRTGREVGERTEILDGLVGGEHVVVSGQFLIDSEASLSGALSRLEAEPTDAPAGGIGTQDMPGMSGMNGAEDKVQVDDPAARKVRYWYDPMVPGKHFDRPGKSPYMDMQLVPKYADEVDEVDAGSGERK